jgi:uncharacterized protein (DUF1499 family)
VYVKPGLIPLCLAGVAVAAPLASGRLVPPPLAVATIATVGAIALVAAALLGWRVLRHRTGRPSLVAALCCLAIGTIVVLLLFIPPAPPGPRFNDVTTDPAEPPVFISGPAAGQAPPAQFAAWQRDAYPDLAPLVLPVEMTVARARVHAAVTAMPDWTLQAEDDENGTVQALAHTRLFRFEDDVVVRVRAEGAASRIDVRSRSRFGGGDRGANAARIRAFLATVERGP